MYVCVYLGKYFVESVIIHRHSFLLWLRDLLDDNTQVLSLVIVDSIAAQTVVSAVIQ